MRLNDDIRALLQAASMSHDSVVKTHAKIVMEKCTDTEKSSRWYNSIMHRFMCREELPAKISPYISVTYPEENNTNLYVRLPRYLNVVDTLVNQHNVSTKMAKLGIYYPTSILISGASGSGKTELAKFVAKELQIPFIQVNYATLIDSKLGQTANNINKVFDYINDMECVICIDELDAIGTSRNQDVLKEFKNITIQLMQSLDKLSPTSLVIGTTNRIDELDKAVVRRFRLHESFDSLYPSEIQTFVSDYLANIVKNNTGLPSNFAEIIIDKIKIPQTATVSNMINLCNDTIANCIASGIVELDEDC